MKKFITRCRKIVGMLGCAHAANVHDPAHEGSMRAIASSSHAGGASSTHVASSSRVVEQQEEEETEDGEEEEEEDAEEEDAEEEEEEDAEEYDDNDGPQPTQPSQGKRVSHPHQDILSPSPFQKPVPRRRTK
ncbi:histone H3.v1-like [Triticum aestivum]|uniref:histone H3.v1-like n=1 Tax=Triticum aestivum TaxID=4565 RepID=UPI001D022F8A|nr:histone H3.v1-like [Triticum aestivum]